MQPAARQEHHAEQPATLILYPGVQNIRPTLSCSNNSRYLHRNSPSESSCRSQSSERRRLRTISDMADHITTSYYPAILEDVCGHNDGHDESNHSEEIEQAGPIAHPSIPRRLMADRLSSEACYQTRIDKTAF